MTHFVVGLTGGIGTGKTAVSDRFLARGITVADADVAARQIVEPGTPALAEIRAHFGDGIVDDEGRLDRAALRQRIFADKDERRWLESLTHPAIMRQLRDELAASTSDYALLVLSAGTGRSPLIQRMLVVDAPRDVQIQRVTARDSNTPEQVQAITDAQPSRETRIAIAEDVIVNDGSLAKLDDDVER
ncbi:MAG: dephospho-CoA kinase, partial [Pseudomonadales bacterium]|nr:dephospho-CoA kinase [Pseudomonadales bacterium]